MAHQQMITTTVVVLHLLVHTAREVTESARQEGLDHHHMMSTMTEATLEDLLHQESHTHLHQEDMKNHMTVGLHLLPPEGTILTLVEILMLDLEVLLLLEATAATVAEAVVMAVTMIDDTRPVCLESM